MTKTNRVESTTMAETWQTKRDARLSRERREAFIMVWLVLIPALALLCVAMAVTS